MYVFQTPNNTFSYAELIFTTKNGIGWVNQTAFPLGWAIWALMIFIYIFTLPQIRKKKNFEVGVT